MAKQSEAVGTHPQATIPIPPEAFTTPTPEELARNQAYWEGYNAGKMASAALPSPAGSVTYETYRAWVEPYLMAPASPEGWVNNQAVGYNNAMIDASNWLWTHDPNSPHKKPPA